MSIEVRCPKCHSSVLIAQSNTESVTCSSCGHLFSLMGGSDHHSHTLEVVGIVPSASASSSEAVSRFLIIDQIGEGSFGSVWKAWDSQLQRHVALKLPRIDNLAPRELAEFLRDAKAAAQLDHVHIVRIFDIAQLDNHTAIVSELVEGVDLKCWLAKHKDELTFQQTADLIGKIADALHHAHSRGVIHRDLKPGNVMLTNGLEPKVIDFGLARREAVDVTLTTPGLPLGTPAYMPPEQARGEGGTADGRSDVYSLGVILFEMLTGSPPFRGLSTKDLLSQHIHDEPPPPRQLNRNVPFSLDTICLKCLRKEPGRRFQTAQQLSEELRRWREGKPILSRPVGWTERFWLLCRRNPLHSAAYGSAAAACVVILIVSFLRITIARDRERLAKEEAQRLAATNLKLAESESNSRRAAEKSRDLALSRLTDAREAVDLWLTTVGEQLRFVPGLTREREQLLRLAEQDYAKFTSQASDDSNLELERGRVLLRLGHVRRTLSNLTGARESFEEAQGIFERLKQQLPSEGTAVSVAVVRGAKLAWCDASVWLGLLAQDRGDSAAADEHFSSAIDLLERLRTIEGQTNDVDEALAMAIFNRGALSLKRGQLSAARPMIERANQLFAALRYVNRASRRLDALAAGGLELLGAAAREAGQYQMADRHTAAALDILQSLADSESWNLDWQAQHARAALQRAAILQQMGREREELASIETAIRNYESITETHPELAAYQQELVLALLDAARLRLAQGRLKEAKDLMLKTEASLAALRQLGAPTGVIDQLEAHGCDVTGQITIGMGELDTGLEQLQRACELFGELVAANPEFPELKLNLALAQLHCAQAWEQKSNEAQIDHHFQLANTTASALLNPAKSLASYEYAAAFIAAAHADYLYRHQSMTGESTEWRSRAESESLRASNLWKTLIENGKPAPDHVLEYCKFLLNHLDERHRDALRARQLLDGLSKVLPTSPTLHQLRGLALIRSKQFQEAADSIHQAIQYRGDPDARDWYYLCVAQHGLHESDAAKASLEKAQAWQSQHAPHLADFVRLREEVTRELSK